MQTWPNWPKPSLQLWTVGVRLTEKVGNHSFRLWTHFPSKKMIRSVTNCDFFPALQWDVPLYTSCVVIFQALCLCVPTSCLKATAVPVAPLPFLPQRSERRLLFSVVCRCLSGERGQGGAAGRGAEPPAEQPAAAGGVAEHGGSPHQSHWAAVQRQQALLASPLLYSPRLAAARTNTQISRGKDANRAACLYAQYTYFVRAYLQKADTYTHAKTHTSSSNCVSHSWILDLPVGEGVCKSTHTKDILHIPS